MNRHKKHYIKKRQNKPWVFHLYRINSRCNCKTNKDYKYYGGKGIQCKITEKELKKLWFRDKAFNLRQPSIDREDSTKDYTFDNCRFIELTKNITERNIRVCSKIVFQYDLSGNFIKEWKSCNQIERALNFRGNGHISQCCRNKLKTAYGFIWRYKDAD